jgi:hypothetical protein
MKKMMSEIGLCHDNWKYRSKISLPHIAHLRCCKLRCITIGILTLVMLQQALKESSHVQFSFNVKYSTELPLQSVV